MKVIKKNQFIYHFAIVYKTIKKLLCKTKKQKRIKFSKISTNTLITEYFNTILNTFENK